MKNRKKVKEEMSHYEKYVAAMSPEELEEERCRALKNSKLFESTLSNMAKVAERLEKEKNEPKFFDWVGSPPRVDLAQIHAEEMRILKYQHFEKVAKMQMEINAYLIKIDFLENRGDITKEVTETQTTNKKSEEYSARAEKIIENGMNSWYLETMVEKDKLMNESLVKTALSGSRGNIAKEVDQTPTTDEKTNE